MDKFLFRFSTEFSVGIQNIVTQDSAKEITRIGKIIDKFFVESDIVMLKLTKTEFADCIAGYATIHYFLIYTGFFDILHIELSPSSIGIILTIFFFVSLYLKFKIYYNNDVEKSQPVESNTARRNHNEKAVHYL